MLVGFLTIAIGIAIVVFLAEVTIRHAVSLADRYGFSGSFVGLTVLSIGTSIPELVTHVVGSIAILRYPTVMDPISALMIGTNIGSDIFQQNFVLPLVGIVGTVVVYRSQLVSEVGALVAASVLVWFFALGGTIDRVEGLLLLAAYAAYLLHLMRNDHYEQIEPDTPAVNVAAWISATVIAVSFAVMAVVTDQVVRAATTLVELLPISASFFGVIVLGVATALPELTTSLVSIAKGQKDISAGILIGSNITNPLMGIGIGALISRYTVPDVVVLYDLPVKIATAIVLFMFLLRHEDLTKREAAALIALFVAYVALRDHWFPTDWSAL